VKQLRTSGNCVAFRAASGDCLDNPTKDCHVCVLPMLLGQRGLRGGTIASFLQEPSSQARYPHIRFIGALHGKLVSLGPRRIGWLVGLSIGKSRHLGPGPLGQH